MTNLAERRTRIRFTTAAAVRYRGKMRAIIVEIEFLDQDRPQAGLNPFTATVRLAGSRQRYPFSWHQVFNDAANRYAQAAKDRRRQDRAARRKAAA